MTDFKRLHLPLKPLPGFYEGWESGWMDQAIWEWVNSATGTFWQVLPAVYTITADANATENCRLNTRKQINLGIAPRRYTPLYDKIIIEIIMNLDPLANFDNAEFFVGLTPGKANTRTSNNIIGWALTGDTLQTVTDFGGVEEVYNTFGEDIEGYFHSYRIEYEVGRGRQTRFYLDDVLLSTHTVRHPYGLFYINFYIPAEASGLAWIDISKVLVWTKER